MERAFTEFRSVFSCAAAGLGFPTVLSVAAAPSSELLSVQALPARFCFPKCCCTYSLALRRVTLSLMFSVYPLSYRALVHT